jgi:hypothetical protein
MCYDLFEILQFHWTKIISNTKNYKNVNQVNVEGNKNVYKRTAIGHICVQTHA